MSFSKEWEKCYSQNLQQSVWPWSDLVSYVIRYAKPVCDKSYKVLEIGCGAGANIPFFEKLGVDFYGIDGSPSTIKALKKRFPKLKNHLVCADFVSKIPFTERFDLIIDRASLTHNKSAEINHCVKNLLYPIIKSKGFFIGIDWFSTKHSDFKILKAKTVDKYTKENFKKGQFEGVGVVHFSDLKFLKETFTGFEFVQMEHKIISQTIPKTNHNFAAWNFAVRKSLDGK